jgi:tRNA threonylcarbamoyl adenosine modification protein YeaZ
MMLLAFDTSSAAITAALHDGTDVVAQASETGAQSHGELLAPTIDRVLRAADVAVTDVTHLVVGVGPGPFTGLRVGLVTARVMAEVLGVAAYGVCSLDAVAAEAVGTGSVDGPFAVATDARRKEVYLAAYDADGTRRAGPEVVHPADVEPDVASGPVVGAGARLYPEVFADPRAPLLVSGSWLATYAVRRLAAGEPLLDTSPMYLRRPDAVVGAARKRVTQP